MNAARRQQRQLDIVAGRQRNICDRFGVDQRADLGGLGLQLRSFRCDLHGVGHRADVHLEIETCRLIEHQGEAGLHRRVKTGCFGLSPDSCQSERAQKL